MNRHVLAGVVGAGVALLGVLGVACDGDPNLDTAPSVTVQKLNEVVDDGGNPLDSSCWITLSSNDGDYLGPGNLCPVDVAALPAPCPLAGGSDRLRVVVAYDGLGLTPGAQAPLPTVTELLDGVLTDGGASVSLVPDDASDHYLAAFNAPSREVAEMLLAVGVTPGYGYQVPTAFSVDPPAVSVSVLSVCNAGECAPPDGGTASVGSAEVLVSIPGPTPAAVTITTVVGGVVQPTSFTVATSTPRPFSLTDACEGQRDVPGFSGTVTIPTPIAAGDQPWQVCAQWGGSDPLCVQAVPGTGTLAAPAVGLTVENCEAPCMKGHACSATLGGGTVVADVTFPGTTAMQASLVSTVDGVKQLPPVTVTFTQQTFDPDGGVQLKGSAAVPVPAAGSHWVLTAQVEDWLTQTPVSINLVPPVVSPLGVAYKGEHPFRQPGCAPGVLCTGLGPASIDVEMEGVTGPQNVTLTWYQNQGPVGMPQIVSLDMQSEMCGPVSGTVSLAVPTVPATNYELWYQFGTAVPQFLYGPVAVQLPSITVALECASGAIMKGTPVGTQCVQASAIKCGTAGGTVNLMVSAPLELPSNKVALTMVVQGTPMTIKAPTLTPDLSTGMYTGTTMVTIPDTSPWELDAVVGGFSVNQCFAF